jgi:bacteriochlorophyll 4-vinyl reductase
VGLPDMTGLIDEAPVARLHQAMRAEVPDLAPALAFEAGVRTADYILAHRIPRPVQAVLKRCPAWIAGPVLSQRHRAERLDLRRVGAVRGERGWPAVFLIHDNPVVRGERGGGRSVPLARGRVRAAVPGARHRSRAGAGGGVLRLRRAGLPVRGVRGLKRAKFAL